MNQPRALFDGIFSKQVPEYPFGTHQRAFNNGSLGGVLRGFGADTDADGNVVPADAAVPAAPAADNGSIVKLAVGAAVIGGIVWYMSKKKKR